MDLKTKRKEEADNQKEKRKDEVITAAIEIFKTQGIENAKMTDIAEKAEVGVASVYRYFKTKSDLVIEAATRFWEEEIHILYNDFDNDEFKVLNGISRIKKVLNVYTRLIEDHQSFIRFIEEFDNYIINERVPAERLVNYESIITSLKPVIYDALEAGKQDGSIRREINNDLYYNTITHTFMSLCQKLVLRGRILKCDSDIDEISQIKMLIDIVIRYIEK